MRPSRACLERELCIVGVQDNRNPDIILHCNRCVYHRYFVTSQYRRERNTLLIDLLVSLSFIIF
jgi:hypothetical protein